MDNTKIKGFVKERDREKRFPARGTFGLPVLEHVIKAMKKAEITKGQNRTEWDWWMR
jgi:hypothetical protein